MRTENAASHINNAVPIRPTDTTAAPTVPTGAMQDGREQNTSLRVKVHIKGMVSTSPDSCIFTFREVLNSFL